LANLEKELEVLARDSIRKKEEKKKEGIYDENAYTRESRWQNYLDE
jgi:hypothetical protein